MQYRADTDEKGRQRKWRSENQHIKNFLTAEYRAKRRLASPKWLTKEQKDKMKALYKSAKELNLTVDHIVPVNGENVSGLHVPWNLQLLTLEENSKKSNKFEMSENIAILPRVEEVRDCESNVADNNCPGRPEN